MGLDNIHMSGLIVKIHQTYYKKGYQVGFCEAALTWGVVLGANLPFWLVISHIEPQIVLIVIYAKILFKKKLCRKNHPTAVKLQM